jgi:hypothetical protein
VKIFSPRLAIAALFMQAMLLANSTEASPADPGVPSFQKRSPPTQLKEPRFPSSDVGVIDLINHDLEDASTPRLERGHDVQPRSATATDDVHPLAREQAFDDGFVPAGFAKKSGRDRLLRPAADSYSADDPVSFIGYSQSDSTNTTDTANPDLFDGYPATSLTVGGSSREEAGRYPQEGDQERDQSQNKRTDPWHAGEIISGLRSGAVLATALLCLLVEIVVGRRLAAMGFGPLGLLWTVAAMLFTLYAAATYLIHCGVFRFQIVGCGRA